MTQWVFASIKPLAIREAPPAFITSYGMYGIAALFFTALIYKYTPTLITGTCSQESFFSLFFLFFLLSVTLLLLASRLDLAMMNISLLNSFRVLFPYNYTVTDNQLCFFLRSFSIS
jgi:hypothetical protein